MLCRYSHEKESITFGAVKVNDIRRPEKLIESLSAYILPAAVCGTGIAVLFSKKDLFPLFLSGASEGMKTAVGLLPTFVALIVGVRLLYASGMTDLLANISSPLFSKLGIPSELLPLLFTRPFSGSASMAAFSDILERYGADSFVSLCASVIMGSSDTIVYVVAVYFSSVGVKKSRYTLPCAFAVMTFCIFFSCFICRSMFK